MRALTTCLCGLILLAMAGCGSSSSSGSESPEPVKGLLSPVTTAAALEASLKDGLTSMANSEQLAVADAAAAT